MRYWLFYFFVAFCATACGAFFFHITHTLLDEQPLDKFNTARPTILLDTNGIEWARLTRVHADPVSFGRLPSTLINAIVATEDRSFFSHHGISLRDIIRSILVNLKAGGVRQGASTITQQLVKLTYFDQRRVFSRKLSEQYYALLLELQLSKEEIFERYVNSIYYGCGIYGIAAACKAFWNISVEELTLAQSALLAGIICSPSRYCPLINAERAHERQKITLSRMRALGMITAEEYASACIDSTTTCTPPPPCCAPHFRETMRGELEKILGKDRLYSEGFIVQTTLDRKKQEDSVRAFESMLKKLHAEVDPFLDGAAITLELHTGAIRAAIGGYSYQKSQFNRLHAQRQIGSLIKPLIFGAALAEGLSLDDIVIDEPFVHASGGRIWRPKNVNNKFVGPLTRAQALARSNNICAIKTYQEAGHTACATLCNNAGLSVPKEPFLAFALGCIDRNLETITSALALFGQRGLYQKPYFIEWIRDWSGNKIYVHRAEPPYPVLSPTNAELIKDVLKKIPARRCALYGYTPIAGSWGKTGTTNDARNIWFCGGTTTHTTGVYLGRDDNKPLSKQVLASQSAFPVWYAMSAAESASSVSPAQINKSG
jgi:penicillin-binding protein 1A